MTHCSGLILAVRQHAPHMLDVGRMHQRQLLQMAHALGLLGAHQVALARMPAEHLAAGGDLESLGGAAMRLQFQFCFRTCFLATMLVLFRVLSLRRLTCAQAWPPGFDGAPPPFFGASRAIRIFASMRGPSSTSA